MRYCQGEGREFEPRLPLQRLFFECVLTSEKEAPKKDKLRTKSSNVGVQNRLTPTSELARLRLDYTRTSAAANLYSPDAQ
jgi:hypothetical protein